MNTLHELQQERFEAWLLHQQLRERLGKEVRKVWIEWANEQPNPKPSWLKPWEELSEPDKEVDRRIGEELYMEGRASVFNEGFKPPEPIS